jgi:hypothetical protein
VIQQRLAAKTKFGEKRVATPSLIDSKASSLRNEANKIIQNNGSLEDLRWKTDDTLFSMLSFGQ